MNYMQTLILNSIAHFLTDAVCAAALFGPVFQTGDIAAAVLLYNTLAFSTQCVVGLMTDGLRRHEWLAGAGLMLCSLGALAPLPWIARVLLIGLGNSLFHVAGGTVTLKGSGGRAWPLGIFVAPGALGLALGTMFPALLLYFAMPAAALSVIMLIPRQEREIERGAVGKTPWLAVALLLCAVAVRAVGGSAADFPWKLTPLISIATVLCVVFGKAAGGFLCDKLGSKRSAYISIPLAAVLTAFCAAYALPSMAGQLLLNLTMPVTLWLLYRAMPDSPGLAFGLAASALWPGSLLGGMIKLTGPAASLLILACFIFGLWAIVYSEDKIIKGETV